MAGFQQRSPIHDPARVPVPMPNPFRDNADRGNAFAQDQLRANAAPQTDAQGIPVAYASMSRVWRMGYVDGIGQASGGLANIQGDEKTRNAIADASTKTGVAVDDLTAMAIIESTGNRNVGTNTFGYTGLMQMGADAATDVGMDFSTLKGGDNVANNALAGAKYWNVNDRRLDEDVPRDPLHMYLAHQQGAGGTNTLMRNLEEDPTKAASRAQRNNLPGHVVEALGGAPTQQDFHDYWAGKMQAIQDGIAAAKAPVDVPIPRRRPSNAQ